jgi:hypothetical protein
MKQIFISVEKNAPLSARLDLFVGYLSKNKKFTNIV